MESGRLREGGVKTKPTTLPGRGRRGTRQPERLAAPAVAAGSLCRPEGAGPALFRKSLGVARTHPSRLLETHLRRAGRWRLSHRAFAEMREGGLAGLGAPGRPGRAHAPARQPQTRRWRRRNLCPTRLFLFPS